MSKGLTKDLKREIRTIVAAELSKSVVARRAVTNEPNGATTIKVDSELTASKPLMEWWTHEKQSLSNFERRTIRLNTWSIAVSAFAVALTFVSVLITYRALMAASEANRMSRESNIATFTAKKVLLQPVEVGKPIIAGIYLSNVGHAEAEVAVAFDKLRVSRLPEGDMPLPKIEQKTDTLSPGDPENPIAIVDKEEVDQQFLDGLPTFTQALNSGEVVAQKTDYFLVRWAYRSMGEEHEDDYCFFIVRADDLSKEIKAPETQPGYVLLNCPKWGKHT